MHRAISDRFDIEELSGLGALLLVFPDGDCPDAERICNTIAGIDMVSVSHDPRSSFGEDKSGWLELLFEGLTFDLRHIDAPRSVSAGDFEHQLDVSPAAMADKHQALLLLPGPHLAGGQSQMPIFRAQMALAAALGRALDGVAAFAWIEARSIVGRDRFVTMIERWLKGGEVPVPGLISLKEDVDGGIKSVGLKFFTGQELRIEPDHFGDASQHSRLAARLANQLVFSGPVASTEQVTGPDGYPLRLEPSTNGKFVRIWRG